MLTRFSLPSWLPGRVWLHCNDGSRRWGVAFSSPPLHVSEPVTLRNIRDKETHAAPSHPDRCLAGLIRPAAIFLLSRAQPPALAMLTISTGRCPADVTISATPRSIGLDVAHPPPLHRPTRHTRSAVARTQRGPVAALAAADTLAATIACAPAGSSSPLPRAPPARYFPVVRA